MSDNAGSSCEGTSVDLHTVAEPAPSAATSDWTPEEESSLKQALLLYTADKYPTSLERCILIAAQLPTRSAREVALRISLLSAPQHAPVPTQGSKPAPELKRRSATAATAAPATAKAAGSSRHSRANGTAKQQQQQQQAPPQAPPPPPTVPLLSLQALASSAPPAPNLEIQEIPPPGPTPLLPSLSASCFFQSPSTSNTSGEEASDCLVNHATTAAADQGTSGSAETSFGDPTLSSMAATHAASGPAATAPALTSEQSLVNAVQALMEQNYAILNTFKANMQQCKVGENTDLLVRFRDNVVACLNHMNSEQMQGGTIANMPPLPVQPNLELANKFLPPKIGMPMGPMPPMGMPTPGMPPFPFNPAMGHIPGMPLMFPPMGAPPGMMPSMMGMPPPPGMPHMPPFPMPGMPPMPVPVPPGMTPAAPPTADMMGVPGQVPPGVPPGPRPMPRPMGMPMPPMMPAAAMMMAAAPAVPQPPAAAMSTSQPSQAVIKQEPV